MRASIDRMMRMVYAGRLSVVQVHRYVIGDTPTARRLSMQTTALMLRYQVR